MRCGWVLAGLLALLFGCRSSLLPDPAGTATPTVRAAELAKGFWGHSGLAVQGRYFAVLEHSGQLQTFQGMLIIDTEQHQARLVALSDLGAQLFDLRCTAGETTTLSTLPHPGLSGFRGRVANAVRQMLLSHLPGARDEVAEGEELLLRRCQGRHCLVSGFSADGGRLLFKEYQRERELWRTMFSNFIIMDGYEIPTRFDYVDSVQGFALRMEWDPVRRVGNL